MIQALLVDDEPAANQRMRDLLRAYPEVHILGAVSTVAEAAHFAQQIPPDLLFLDMEMPGPVGLELIPLLPATTSVVFVTGHPQYAVQAFDLRALDYLLKPVSPERLALTMERFCSHRTPAPQLPYRSPQGKKITQHFFSHSEILWIESLQNYTRVQLSDGRSLLIRKTLTEWLEELPPAEFIRLDRSLLIQIALLSATRRESRDRTILHFHGLTEGLAIGRLAANRLRELNRHS